MIVWGFIVAVCVGLIWGLIQFERRWRVRLVPALASVSNPPEQAVAKIAALRASNNDKLHYGIVKLVVDGSIQGFTARLRWPGYHNGAANGLWYIAPEELPRLVDIYHKAGIQLHIHTNGDEASELATEMIGRAVSAHPRGRRFRG